ncbi:MAG: hypothetical protein ACAH80_08320 [Alphaproteobacteria bacterium]
MSGRNIFANVFVLGLALINVAGLSFMRHYQIPDDLIGCDVAQSLDSAGRILSGVLLIFFVAGPVALTGKREYSVAATFSIVGTLIIFFWVGWAQDGKYYQIGKPLATSCAEEAAVEREVRP